jgi:hypothetical protein|tara:strand:- start:807 stop:959 length:153 start_codon:yes stop_codon:yes gene_type:complete
MIENIITLLKIIKKENISARYIDIALGKNKLPETLKEGYELLKREIWQKK